MGSNFSADLLEIIDNRLEYEVRREPSLKDKLVEVVMMVVWCWWHADQNISLIPA